MKRAKHNLSHYRLTTFDHGYLVPTACVEVLPGDSIRHSVSALLRIGPHAGLVAPLMHPDVIRIHCWFVPNRIVWADWEEFITKTNDALTVPTHTETPSADALLDHLGVPTGSSQTVNELPIRAYNLIWNTFYRDQELQTERAEDATTLARICWEKDYFTTARTYPQFGADTISIPFGTADVPVIGIGPQPANTPNAAANILMSDNTNQSHPYYAGSTANHIRLAAVGTGSGAIPNIYAKMSLATGGIDVNEFRQALALQRFLEARARFGGRYRDYLRYLGIRPRDGRLSEPEYLGGGKQHVAFSEVLAHAEGTNTEVGSMAGHGIGAVRTRAYTKFFEESGYILCLVSVRPKAMYMQAVHRHWLRSTCDDFWQKEYEAFGPQPVLVKEIYGPHGNATDVFGYVDRFREYREHPSSVAGDFRDSTSDYWHMARSFGSAPSLNSSFVECAPTDRVYGDANAPELVGMFNHHIVARRLVAKHARF